MAGAVRTLFDRVGELDMECLSLLREMTKLANGISFAPIGLIEMFNSGRTVSAFAGIKGEITAWTVDYYKTVNVQVESRHSYGNQIYVTDGFSGIQRRVY